MSIPVIPITVECVINSELIKRREE